MGFRVSYVLHIYYQKVLQPQSKHSGMVCMLASGRISADSHKSGEASVVVMM
jgi:hypothetical protein